MKQLKKALLSTAVLAGLAAGNAYAGTEACFEVYKGADGLAVAAFDTTYGNAACVAEAARVGASATDLEPTKEALVAYELTGELEIDFDAVDGVDTDQYIVYIPTTDIPSGTEIRMELSGANATFFGNANQIHLVKYDEVADDGSFVAVASSDGAVDGETDVTFLTKAGVTIGAGTRLVLSRVSVGAAAADLDPIGIKIENDTCTSSNSTASVTIRSTYARTDGGTGFNIEGGVSKAQVIADISPQFYTLADGTTAEVEVNAESADSAGTAVVARTEFVYDAGDVANQLVAKRYEAVYKTAFYNRGPVLDQAVALGPDDHLETAFVASSDPRSNVTMCLWNGRTAATGALDTQEEVETGTDCGAFGLTLAGATVYDTEATMLFTPEAGAGDAETNPALAGTTLDGADYNVMYYVVTNEDPASIMNFNYEVNAHYTLDFNDAALLDHCAANKNTHDVGVNGAVLKVPYTFNAAGNFVRVTNEHDEAAEVTVDIFGESADGTTGTRAVEAVALGQVPAKSSVVYFVPDIIAEATASANYAGADGGYAAGATGVEAVSNNNRHTMTFTVTAPRDKVHGFGVQRLSTGDRVTPVLDLNDWRE